jgi:hypothetical protein
MVGAGGSGVTVTVEVSVALFPDGSVAVYTTLVVPTGKRVEMFPGGCEVTVTIPELSTACGIPGAT